METTTSARKTCAIKVKLTFWEKFWLILFDRTHVVNVASGEIHRLESKTKNCKLHMMKWKNKFYITTERAKMIVEQDEFNGCRWCWKEEDRG